MMKTDRLTNGGFSSRYEAEVIEARHHPSLSPSASATVHTCVVTN